LLLLNDAPQLTIPAHFMKDFMENLYHQLIEASTPKFRL